jgi:hypothetical protein
MPCQFTTHIDNATYRLSTHVDQETLKLDRSFEKWLMIGSIPDILDGKFEEYAI